MTSVCVQGLCPQNGLLLGNVSPEPRTVQKGKTRTRGEDLGRRHVACWVIFVPGSH